MKICIIYDSFFGNTEKIARIISDHLSENNEVQILKVGEAEKLDLKDVNLLIVGSPTRAFEPTKPVVTFIKKLKNDEIKTVKIALFDTRIDIKAVNNRLLTFLVKHKGYACTTMRTLFMKKDAELIGESVGFFVLESEGPLKDGEEDRARLWANTLI